MIQRIQSLWFLFASALAFITLKVPFFSGNKIVNNVKQFEQLTGMSNMLIMILTVGIALACLVSVFLYKNRKQQRNIALITLFVAVLNDVLYFLQTRNFVPGEGTYNLTSLLTFSIPVFIFLSVRSIARDEKLVKSLDRLR